MEIESIETTPRSPVPLYVVTIFLELVFGVFRAASIGILFVIVGIMLNLDSLLSFDLLQGFSMTPVDGVGRLGMIGVLLSYANVITSIFAFLGFGGGSLQTRLVLGARKLSVREADLITAALEQVRADAPGTVTSFTKLYIVDSMMEFVNLVGTTLYVSSAAAKGEHLPVLLAHELGHIQHGDGSVILALRRLVFPPFSLFVGHVQDFSTNRPPRSPEPVRLDLGGALAQTTDFTAQTVADEWKPMQLYYSIIIKVLFVLFAALGGGLGVVLTSWWWASYFRQRDYFADDFAVAAGFEGELVSYLEQFMFYSTTVPYMMGWQPAHELRLDRMQRMGGDGPRPGSVSQHSLSESVKKWVETHPDKVQTVITTAVILIIVYVLLQLLLGLSTAFKAWYETSWFGVTVRSWILMNKWWLIGGLLLVFPVIEGIRETLKQSQSRRERQGIFLIAILFLALVILLLFEGVRQHHITQANQVALAELEEWASLERVDYQIRASESTVNKDTAVIVSLITVTGAGGKVWPREAIVNLSMTGVGWQQASDVIVTSPYLVQIAPCKAFFGWQPQNPEGWPCLTIHYDGKLDYNFYDQLLWWYGYSNNRQQQYSGVLSDWFVEEDGGMYYVLPFTWQELIARGITYISLDLPEGVEILSTQRLEQ